MPDDKKMTDITLEPDAERGVAGGTYEVRQYSPPAKDDLNAYKRLIHEFRERFLHFVDNGYSITLQKQPDRFIEQQRKLYESPDTPEILRDEAGRMLCTALLMRSMDTMEKHLDLRIEAKEHKTKPDQARLDALRKQISDDITETVPLPNMVRKGGAPDLDNARIEMLYEPARVFNASIYEDGLEEFYRTRTIKVAQAMDSLKQIGQTVSKITEKYPVQTIRAHASPEPAAIADKQKAIISQVETLFPQMIDAAVQRIQTLHSDPDYQEANTVYKASRNKIFAVTANRLKEMADESQTPHAAALNTSQKQEMDTLYCLQEAIKDVYDLAITHDPHPVAIQLLKARVESIAQQKPQYRSARSY